MGQPGDQAFPGLMGQLELHGLPGLLLRDGRAVPDRGVDDELADAQLHEVTTAQLAVYGELEQRQVADAALALKGEPDEPDLFGLEGQLGPDKGTRVPGHHGADRWNRGFRLEGCMTIS